MEDRMDRYNTDPKLDDRFKVSRRKLLTAGGATLVAATVLRATDGAAIKTADFEMKPVVLPPAGSKDPVEFSAAESRFWNEQNMEHSQFFIMLMPGAELARERGEAERFQRTFADKLSTFKSASIDRSNYGAYNRSVIELVKPYAEWQRKMADRQASGKLRSLVWSTFFDHTALEAEHLVQRLEQFNRGDVSADLRSTAEFWTQIMGEHADFIAHLLDPAERDLIMKAMLTGDNFHKMHDSLPPSKDPLENAVNEIVDFKTAAEKGIVTGKIRSIIHPTLADHVRREALKAADDLKRAA